MVPKGLTNLGPILRKMGLSGELRRNPAEDFCLVHHGQLGYVPRLGFRGFGAPRWSVTIDADGLRSCGDTPPVSGDGAILAVGDSYTFGEGVSDAESWPAQLQRLSGRRVLNGGVSGYGFDQIVLRAEQLASIHRPSIIVVGFIADDIRRTEMRRLWWRDKPWFIIEGDELVLKGAPVPRRKGLLPLPVRHRAQNVLNELPASLQHLSGYHIRAQPAGRGQAIARYLVRRLGRLQSETRSRVVLLAQYHPHVWIDKALAAGQRRITRDILELAASSGIATVDTFQRFAVEPAPQQFYSASHMNARDNLPVASLLAATLPAMARS